MWIISSLTMRNFFFLINVVEKCEKWSRRGFNGKGTERKWSQTLQSGRRRERDDTYNPVLKRGGPCSNRLLPVLNFQYWQGGPGGVSGARATGLLHGRLSGPSNPPRILLNLPNFNSSLLVCSISCLCLPCVWFLNMTLPTNKMILCSLVANNISL